jgi:hypothetical protein
MGEKIAAPSRRDLTLRTAALAAAFGSCVAAVYTAAGVEPAPAIWMFVTSAPAICVFLWLQKDAARTHVGSVLDLGYFLFLAWPVVLPWYLVKTRGWKGLITLGGMLALVCAPYLAALFVYWLIYISPLFAS